MDVHHLGIRSDTGKFVQRTEGYIELPYDHESVNHSVGEYIREQAHTNGVESFWVGNVNETCHRMSKKHPEHPVTEFAGRHNVRKLDTMDQNGISC